MTDAQDRTVRFIWFLVGVALPLAGFALWSRKSRNTRHSQIDQAHDITVEDSFPASDPPSAW
jgi:hypothetical protein